MKNAWSKANSRAPQRYPKKNRATVYNYWILCCLGVLFCVGCACIQIIQDSFWNTIDDEYTYVSSKSLSEEERRNWNPDAIRQRNELKYKQNRTVCVERTTNGHCAPVFCDNHRPASWTNIIIRPLDIRGTRSMMMSTSNPTKDEAEGGRFNVCAISEEYQFIFVPTLRSGGGTILSILKKGMCDGGSFDETTLQCTNQDDGKSGRERLRFQECAEVVSTYPDYKVFTFVRNPYSRWLSAYAMGVAFSRSQFKNFPLTIEEFLFDPKSLTKYSWVQSNYWTSQMNFFLDYQGCPVVDFIGHLELFDQDMAVILNIIGRPSPLIRYFEENNHDIQAKKSFSYRQNATASGVMLDESMLSETAIELIQQRSITEIALLGYGSHYPFV